MHIKTIFLFILLILSTQFVLADPITQEEAQEWIERVHDIYQWPADFDSRAYFEKKLKIYEALMQLPFSSPQIRRNYADALHDRAHFFEHDHNYEQALTLHRKALEVYKTTPLPSISSYNGITHSLEHIFMDLYDYGVLLERTGDQEKAIFQFEEAMKWADHYRLSVLVTTDRVGPRYKALKRKHTLGLIFQAKNDTRSTDHPSCQKVFNF